MSVSVVLSVFSANAFKEFVLPMGNNIHTSLTIRRDVFGLAEDKMLHLENNDGEWSFAKNSQEDLVKADGSCQDGPLRHGDYIFYRQQGKTLLAIMVRISARRFTGYSKYALLGQNALVGTDPKCAFCYSFEHNGAQYVTHEHAVFTSTAEGITLTDQSVNGVFVNDLRVHGSVQLQFGDRIDIWGLRMVSLGKILAVQKNENLTVDMEQVCQQDLPQQPLQEAVTGKILYHRSPRNIGNLATGTVSIDSPPAPQNEAEPPILMTIGPALTMALPMVAGSALAVLGSRSGSPYMYTGIITSVLSAVIGALWALANLRYTRKDRKEKEKQRFTAYSEYLVKLTGEIRQDYENNRTILLQAYPSASQCVQNGQKGLHLWERNIHHADFLSYRLGLGDLPFQKQIRVDSEKFDIVRDSLREKPRMIRENFQTLHQVPVCVDLQKERLVGLVGGPDLAGARAILRNLVAQMAAQNCYTDLKLAFLYREEQGCDPERWEYCHWFPHVWSQGHKTRFIACNQTEASDVLYEIASVLRVRSETHLQADEGIVYRPWYVLVFEDSSILQNEPIAKYLLDSKQNLGVTTLFLANQTEDLPNECECIIRNDAEYMGMYHTRMTDMEPGRIQMETVDSAALEYLSRYLCNVEVHEVEQGGEIPDSITFFEMYNADRPEQLNAEERWKHNRSYENMRALIGKGSGDKPCYLDVHEKYHGPHGLIAGTTGSGKSETLQTYILSLALNFSPHDVGFFLIDYKGGGMANLFRGLPHTLGAISNLSGGQIQRAMVSIKSENMRRQRIFNENDVNNINLYTALYKNGEATVPVPHLFIIIDEFAELKREQREFMDELISVAQVGRSLGVHLILATQKPSGTVDENISSNARFRLCLRVQDRQDSMEMLHKPDAAYLTQAGRGFLQVGSDEVFEQFQSGWSGASYDEETADCKQVLAKMLTNPGHTAIIGSYAKRQQKEKLQQAWMERLVSMCSFVQTRENCEDNRREQAAQLYCLMEQEEIDYPRSEFNTKALYNLMDLVQQAKNAGVEERAQAKWIAEMATMQGVRLPEKKNKTQLDATVKYLADTARRCGYQPLPPLWMEPLPDVLYLEQVEGWKESVGEPGSWPQYDRKWSLASIIGRTDDPEHQRQMPMWVNFSQGGHHALVGAASSGKSTFVQTLLYSLIRRYSPQMLNVYILDYSNRMSRTFEKAPHVGGILFEDAADKVGKLFYLLRTIVNERKALFNGGNYEQYIMANGTVCPAILLVVDNIANFREKTGEAYDDEIVRLAREGISYGVYLLVTGAGFGTNDIYSRLADNLRTTICLEMADMPQYSNALHTTYLKILPKAGVHGRGLASFDDRILEFQTALAMETENMYRCSEIIAQECEEMRARWKNKCARPIPFIPEDPTWTDLMEREEMPTLLADKRCLPIGYDYATAGIYSINLRTSYCYIVSGHARSGKTNVLKLIMRAAKEKGMRISVLEPEGGALKNESDQLGAERFVTVQEMVNFVGELGPTFSQRHEIQKQLIASGAEEDEQFERMSQEQPWLVVVSDLIDFLKLTETATAKDYNLGGSLVNLIGKGFMHNIYFAVGFDQDRRMEASGKPLYEEFVKDRNGIHLGGSVGSQQLFVFSDMPFGQQNTPEKPGIGLVPPRDGQPYRRVVLPIARG